MSNAETTSDDLPVYQVRISQRAKRMQLKISPLGEVEVVLPKRVSAKHVAPFVAQHQTWIQQTQQQMAALYPPEELLPGTLNFAATQQQWQLEYLEGIRPRVAEIEDTLKIYSQDNEAAKKALQCWLNRRADGILVPWLREVSDETGLTFKRAVIRAQKSRWGSCSSSGTISLNRALLFMPPQTVRYLFIHELCHTREMNHSPRYWALVERHMPDYQHHERVLDKGLRAIPRWALSI